MCSGDGQTFCLLYWLPPQHSIHQCPKIHPLPGPPQNNPAAQAALGSGPFKLLYTGFKKPGEPDELCSTRCVFGNADFKVAWGFWKRPTRFYRHQFCNKPPLKFKAELRQTVLQLLKQRLQISPTANAIKSVVM